MNLPQEEQITFNRKSDSFQQCVDRLMRDPYNDQSYTREEIEGALWTWFQSCAYDLISMADEFTHGPNPFHSKAFEDALLMERRFSDWQAR